MAWVFITKVLEYSVVDSACTVHNMTLGMRPVAIPPPPPPPPPPDKANHGAPVNQ